MTQVLARNALANVLQMLAGTAMLFVLYRYISLTLGIDRLGVWSVVLATVSASRLADLGLSAGVTRFVARDLARCPERAGEVIDTAALSLMAAIGTVLPLLSSFLAKLLPFLFNPPHQPEALEILPYALMSLWLTMVGAVFQGGLDGCQRMDLRSGLVVIGQAVFLALSFWLVPKYGLVGLAWAQVGQGLFLVVGGRFLLRRVLPQLPRLPRRWRKAVFRELMGYGANAQAATLFMVLFDPITKILMARFGGVAAAGYFEMANQVVLKVRAMILAAVQALVPRVAELEQSKSGDLTLLYRNTLRGLAFVTLPTFAVIFAWAGGLSWLLLGDYTSEFVFLLQLCIVAQGLNTFAGPAYFTNLGTGHLGKNTLAQVAMGCLNATLGWLFGDHYGAAGVAVAYAIALGTGSGLLLAFFEINHGARSGDYSAVREHLVLAAAGLMAAAFGSSKDLWMEADLYRLAAGLLLTSLPITLAVWFHPLRGDLWRWLTPRAADPAKTSVSARTHRRLRRWFIFSW